MVPHPEVPREAAEVPPQVVGAAPPVLPLTLQLGGSSGSMASAAADASAADAGSRPGASGSDESAPDVEEPRGSPPQQDGAEKPPLGKYEWLGSSEGFLAVVKAHMIMDMIPGLMSALISVACYDWAHIGDEGRLDSAITLFASLALFLRLPILVLLMNTYDDLAGNQLWGKSHQATFEVCRHRLLVLSAVSFCISLKALCDPMLGGFQGYPGTKWAGARLVAPCYNLVLGVAVLVATLSSLTQKLPVLATCRLQDVPGIDLEDGQLSCAVCLEQYEASHEVTQLSCRHIFHKDCIELWVQRKLSCPLRCPIELVHAYI